MNSAIQLDMQNNSAISFPGWIKESIIPICRLPEPVFLLL